MSTDKDMPHADVIAPLRELTKLHEHFIWTKECQREFMELKRRLSHRTVLVPR